MSLDWPAGWNSQAELRSKQLAAQHISDLSSGCGIMRDYAINERLAQKADTAILADYQRLQRAVELRHTQARAAMLQDQIEMPTKAFGFRHQFGSKTSDEDFVAVNNHVEQVQALLE